jgi:3-hydroxy acid dehydrogenase/malonic semialdehyde reductase
MSYSTRYKPKNILITGATGGFGKALAHKFSEIGCNIILHGRSEENLNALSKKLKSKTHSVCFDITDKDAMKSAINALPKNFSKIDLLINNAGGAYGQEPFFEANSEDLEYMININCTSLIELTRLVLPIMIKQKRGHIINIGSIAGSYAYPGGHVYCAAKAFVNHFSLALRSDLEGKNIRVTNLEPGMVETDFSLVRFKGDKEKANAVYKNANPMKPEDVAETAFWVSTLPEHFNINRIEMMPTSQSSGPLQIYRSE